VAYTACTVVNDIKNDAACSETCFICLVKNELTMLAQLRRYTPRKEKNVVFWDGTEQLLVRSKHVHAPRRSNHSGDDLGGAQRIPVVRKSAIDYY